MIGGPIGYPIGGVENVAVSGISGSLSVTEASDTVVAASTVLIKATASLTEAGDTAAATGALAITGTEAGQEVSDKIGRAHV